MIIISATGEQLYPVNPGKYPESWKPKDKKDKAWKQTYFDHMDRIKQDYKEKGVLQAPLIQDLHGLLPVQEPSPSSKDIDDKKKVIYVKKNEKDNTVSFSRIDLTSLNTYKAAGWELWQPTPRPAENFTDKETRLIPGLKESHPVSESLKETAVLFSKGIQISAVCDGLDWHPGQLLGPDSSAEAPISKTPTFMLPSESGNNLASATSRGHIHTHDRPKLVGAGWGDYDLFFEWQLHGRVLDVNDLEEKTWNYRDEVSINFVPASVLEDGEEKSMSSYDPGYPFKTPPPLYMKATGREREWKDPGRYTGGW
ncbi:unnamed protein product [Clonostachys byssicola]|uniref:Uncharacterized protein n=1 Tax=Clonostachys byssicola TaxID=160290 RepID=A0A9N9U5G7_9HYPO|nr:unnamed protein product [Clonostachys byssicola]